MIGDVHGCFEEFDELVVKLSPGAGDRVICLGDFMDKGPEPVKCLRFAQIAGFECVAANHEERHARFWRREQRRKATGEPNRMRPFHDAADLEANEKLTLEDVVWMETRPPWIEVIPSWVAVHGGFKPGVPLSQQDPKKVIRMRWVDAENEHLAVNYEENGTVAWTPPEGAAYWTERWTGPESVVYGHEAFHLKEPKVNVHESRKVDRIYGSDGRVVELKVVEGSYRKVETWGIDTGVVHGGHLTALVFGYDGSKSVVQVKAKRVYMEPPGDIPGGEG